MKNLALAYGMKKKAKKECNGGKMAEGGMVDEKASGYVSHPDQDDDMVMRIMRKRYSEGGVVSNEDAPMADSMPAEFDDLELDDHLEGHDTAAGDGDDLGDAQEDEDQKDVVARIMRSRAKKDRLPNPR